MARRNQYIQLVKFLYCKLSTIGKQLPTFLHGVWGLNCRHQRWEASSKYVVGPQGLGKEKVAGLAKNSKDRPIADVIYIFQPTKFSKRLFLIMNQLPLQCIKNHMFTNIVINLLTRGL